MKIYSITLCFFLTTTFAFAQYPLIENRSYVAVQVQTSLKIDGKADEEAWENAPWTEAFVDIQGDRRPLPQWGTRVKMLWDTNYFYFYAQLEEPHIWATLKQRDTVIFYDNDFEIFIDPDGDLHSYLEYEVNANNTVWDLLLTKPYRDEGHAINHWNMGGLQSAVHINGTLNQSNDEDEYWSVEVAIPWEVIDEAATQQFPPEHGDALRVNFSRVQWETDIINGRYVKKKNPETGKNLPENNWVWSPQRVINMHEPEFWGMVYFSTTKQQDPQLQIHPAREEVRQLLSHIHRQQLLFYKENGYFQQNGEALLAHKAFSNGKPITWKLQVSTHDYHAEMQHPDLSEELWHMNRSGQIWKTKQ